MKTEKPGIADQLKTFARKFVEEMLATPDKEVMEVASSEYDRPELQAARLRSMLQSTATEAGRRRLVAAKATVNETSVAQSSVEPKRSLDEKRAVLARLRAQHPDVTLAARKGAVESEEEIDSLLADFAELGIKDDSGN